MSSGKIAFCFPGQGSLQAGMGKAIAEAVPESMEVFRRASEASGLDLMYLCFDAPEEELFATEVQQPALVATSLAMLAAVRSRGINPDFVVGHSVGEFAALAAARMVKLEDAIALVRERGMAMAETARRHPGSMAAILGLDDEAVERAIGIAREMGARRAVKLRVSGAFHSPLVERAADRFRPALERVRFSEPVFPFVSTVTARVETARRMGPLLLEQLTAPVRFTQAAQELVREGVHTFVEVGPGNVLSGLVKRIDRDVQTISVDGPAALDKLEETLSAV